MTKLKIAIFCYNVQIFCSYMATLVADSHPTHIPKSDIVLLLLVIKSDCNTNQYQNLQFSFHSVCNFSVRTLWSHSRMELYFFSYLLTCEVYLIEVLEIMAQMLQYITFLSLKAIKVSSNFILNYLKKVVGGATTQKYQKQMLKP